jgi:hypothetical protein
VLQQVQASERHEGDNRRGQRHRPPRPASPIGAVGVDHPEVAVSVVAASAAAAAPNSGVVDPRVPGLLRVVPVKRRGRESTRQERPQM